MMDRWPTKRRERTYYDNYGRHARRKAKDILALPLGLLRHRCGAGEATPLLLLSDARMIGSTLNPFLAPEPRD